MDPSTGNTASVPTKRARFDLTAKGLEPDESPLASAIKQVQGHTASLQPTIATILSNVASDYIRMQHKVFSKERQIKRFETDKDLIPRSAKSGFELRVMKEALSDSSFIAIQAELQPIVANSRKTVKTRSLRLIKSSSNCSRRTARNYLP